MLVIKIIIEIVIRRISTTREFIIFSQFKRKIQAFRIFRIPRTFEKTKDSQNVIAARLKARIIETEKTQKIKRLKERLIKIEKGEIENEMTFAIFSQILKQKQKSESMFSFYTDMNTRFVLFKIKYSAINMKHFKNIIDNKFESKNICKFITNFTNVKKNKKYIKMRKIDLQIRENDVSLIDIKKILQLLFCFLIYVQILKHFINFVLRNEFDKNIMFYIDRLIKHAHVRI